MKIKKAKWNNHAILGNLELDFTNPATGKPFDTVLFAGENGTGKTTILETLSTFLNLGSFEPFESIEYIVDNDEYKAISAQHTIPDFYNAVGPGGNTIHFHSNRNNNRGTIEGNRIDIRSHGCVFSKARADYKTQQIKNATTAKLDTEKYDTDNDDNFTSLKQLIVDIQNQDSNDYMQLNRTLGASPKSVDEFFPSSKIFRFKTAFDNFFPRLKYDQVVDNDSEKSIMFIKNGKSISIDNLSTGEKQIVFRGIYLLKNLNKLDGAAIMIDEPELSMHPKWQQKILQYYKDLFTTGTTQRTQLFVATHSESVLEQALLNKSDNLVIVLKETSGLISSAKIDAPSVLPSITVAETNYLAFDIVSNDYHIELYGYLQYKHSLNVKACDTYITNQSQYNPALHHKPSAGLGTTTYNAISTYIRNAIDHPDPTRTYTEAELRISIELLIELCR